MWQEFIEPTFHYHSKFLYYVFCMFLRGFKAFGSLKFLKFNTSLFVLKNKTNKTDISNYRVR